MISLKLLSMKGVYDVKKEFFFELDDRGKRRHDQKLFEGGFRLDIRKFAFRSC